MTKKINTLTVLTVSFLLAIGCIAQSDGANFPKGCVGGNYHYNGNNLVISENSPKQSLFLFHNVSDQEFWLNHPVTNNPGASAGWASSISAGNWSALTLSKGSGLENFKITCATMGTDGKLDYLDCEDVIRACGIENPVFNSEDSGSYWVAEDKPLDELVNTIKSHGINWKD